MKDVPIVLPTSDWPFVHASISLVCRNLALRSAIAQNQIIVHYALVPEESVFRLK